MLVSVLNCTGTLPSTIENIPMNKAIFNQVHALAEKLMQAAEKENVSLFHSLYDELESLCIDHDGSKKDHPMQWEALADFTEEFEDAVEIYEKALAMAKENREFDYQASIQFSMARVFVELEKSESAQKSAEAALEAAGKAQDAELESEIKEWLKSYSFYN